jgi:transposase
MRERLTLTTREQQRIEIVSRWLAGIVTTAEAVDLLGCSERTAWRLRAAMLASGADGIAHGNRGRVSSRRVPAATRSRIAELARTTYRGYNDTHLAEVLAEDEGIAIGRSSLRRLLRSEGLASPRRRRPPRYRSRRERMAQAGLLVQVDGSRHDWLEGRGPWLTLVGGIDDATGIIVGATFRDAEDGVGYLTIVRDMARRHGPKAPYQHGLPESLNR